MKEMNQNDYRLRVAESLKYHRKCIELMGKLPAPTANFTSNRSVIPGETIEIGLKDYKPLSIIFSQESPVVISTAKRSIGRFVVLFQGQQKQIPVLADFDKRKKCVKVKVPEAIVDGVVSLLIPIEEAFDSEEAMEIAKDADEQVALFYRQTSPSKHIKNTQSGSCQCKSGNSKHNNSEVAFGDQCIKHKPGLKIMRYQPAMIGWLTVRCRQCTITCPNNAIKFDANGDCYVDPALCMGHRYQTDRSTLTNNDNFLRINESSCWQCFESNEYYSNYCRQKKLRKVLHIDDCGCANCPPESCHIDGLNLMALCENGAISMQPSPQPSWYYFVGDKQKCTGCMLCYDNITCFNNVAPGYYIRMISMIDNEAASLSISLVRLFFIPKSQFGFPPEIEASLMLMDNLHKKQYPFELRPDNGYAYQFPSNSFMFSKKVYIAVMMGQSYIGYYQSSLGLPAVFLGDLGGSMNRPQKAVLKTRTGDFVLEYIIAC